MTAGAELERADTCHDPAANLPPPLLVAAGAMTGMKLGVIQGGGGMLNLC